ncbi:MAG: hypothetical protein ABR612_05060 [Chromatocurvus sp.]
MNKKTEIDYGPLTRHVRNRIADLLAIDVFGSRAGNNARDDSDFDMAVLLAGFVDPPSPDDQAFIRPLRAGKRSQRYCALSAEIMQ